MKMIEGFIDMMSHEDANELGHICFKPNIGACPINKEYCMDRDILRDDTTLCQHNQGVVIEQDCYTMCNYRGFRSTQDETGKEIGWCCGQQLDKGLCHICGKKSW